MEPQGGKLLPPEWDVSSVQTHHINHMACENALSIFSIVHNATLKETQIKQRKNREAHMKLMVSPFEAPLGMLLLSLTIQAVLHISAAGP